MCTCALVWVYMYMCVSLHMCMWGLFSCVSTCMLVCAHLCVQVHCVFWYVRSHIYVCVVVCVCMLVYSSLCVCWHMCVCSEQVSKKQDLHYAQTLKAFLVIYEFNKPWQRWRHCSCSFYSPQTKYLTGLALIQLTVSEGLGCHSGEGMGCLWLWGHGVERWHYGRL